METQYVHMIGNLFGVLVLLMVVLYLTKKFKLTRYATNKYIKIINAVSIGSKEKVILMEVNNTILLIGATPSHVETLYVFDSLQAKDAQTDSDISFAEQAAKLDMKA